MPKLIDQAVKLEIIKLHLEGKGRNFIAESVTGVSSGTVSNVIKQYQKQPSETIE